MLKFMFIASAAISASAIAGVGLFYGHGAMAEGATLEQYVARSDASLPNTVPERKLVQTVAQRQPVIMTRAPVLSSDEVRVDAVLSALAPERSLRPTPRPVNMNAAGNNSGVETVARAAHVIRDMPREQRAQASARPAPVRAQAAPVRVQRVHAPAQVPPRQIQSERRGLFLPYMIGVAR